MADEAKIIAESKSAEVIHTATVHAEAQENSREAQMNVFREETSKMLAAAIKDAFGENKTSGRFIDVSRIPMICKNIENIDGSLTEIKSLIEKNRVAREDREKENDKRYVNVDQFAPLVEKVGLLTDNQKWVVRTIGALVIAAVMGLVLVKARV